MVGNLELFVTSVALLVMPFVAYGIMWLLSRLVVGDEGRGRRDRVVPPSTNQPSRVIPGTRSEETD